MVFSRGNGDNVVPAVHITLTVFVCAAGDDCAVVSKPHGVIVPCVHRDNAPPGSHSLPFFDVPASDDGAVGTHSRSVPKAGGDTHNVMPRFNIAFPIFR